jgi:hypothetical protein
METFNYRSTRPLTVSMAVTALLAIMTLALLYSGFPFFGPVNDLVNALFALLSAVLAASLHVQMRKHLPGTALYFMLAVWAGSVLIIINSILVAIGQMDWMTGGMYTAIGYSLTGIWLLVLNQKVVPQLTDSPGLSRLGTVTAIGMLFGLLAGPLLAMRVSLTQNPLAMIAFAGAGVGYLLYPVWAWLLGRRLLKESANQLAHSN